MALTTTALTRGPGRTRHFLHCFALIFTFALRATNGYAQAAPGGPLDDGDPAADLSAPAFAELFVQPAGAPPTPRHTGVHALVKGLYTDVKRLPSKENLLWFAVGGGLALSLHPVDDNINTYFATHDSADAFFKPGAILGQFPTLISASLVTYVVGRASDKPKVSHIGMDLIQSLLLSEGMVELLKYTTRRERPDMSGHNSFPSGHAADTFAFATAFERHMGWRYAVPAYIFASYVAISRLPANRHWASDVAFGAATGIVAGRTVTLNEEIPYPVTLAPVPGGIAVMFVRRNDRHEPRSSAKGMR